MCSYRFSTAHINHVQNELEVHTRISVEYFLIDEVGTGFTKSRKKSEGGADEHVQQVNDC